MFRGSGTGLKERGLGRKTMVSMRYSRRPGKLGMTMKMKMEMETKRERWRESGRPMYVF